VAPEAEAPVPFYTRYGIARTGEREAPLVIEPCPELCRAGSMRATVTAAAVDIVGSLFTRERAGIDVLSTTDLSIRLPAAGVPARLRVHGRVLRSGRTGVTTAVELWAEGPGGGGAGDASEEAGAPGVPWACGETSFARSPRAPDNAITPEKLALPAVFARNPLTQPLEDEVGVAVVDAGRGEVELVLRRAVLNAEGTLQGALVALLVERAGEALAEARLGAPQRVCALDLRYLATAKVGPVRSQAAFIGDPAMGMLRVELRDAGRDDRITATAFLRVAAAR